MKPFRELAEQAAELRRAKRRQAPPPHTKTERNAEIARMRRNGASLRQIASAFGITSTRVRVILDRRRHHDGPRDWLLVE